MESKEEQKQEGNPYLGKRVDPIPPTLKELFFQKDLKMPNYSEDYDVLGFDADHCFVKYNLHAYTRLLISIDLKDLHEVEGYPEEILDFDLADDSEDVAIC